ncbi:MAG: hypothetical protein ORN26_00290 [Candidatus Pacebacteria bacterium]|nr:hypothetical protein [Candidatus Paceibacterota bacterium]
MFAWTNISSATSSSYTPPTTSVGTTAYRVIASNSQGSATSSSARINVYSAQGATPVLVSATSTTSNLSSQNNNGANIGSFTLQAGSNSSVTLNQINITLSITADSNGLGLAGLRNITLKNGATTIGSVYATAGASSTAAQSTILSFPANISVPANGSATFNLTADIAGLANNVVISTIASIQYTENLTLIQYNSPSTPTTTITIGTPVLANPIVSVNTPVAQYIVGGGTNQPGAVFSLKTTQGSTNISQLKFRINGSGSSAVQSLVINGLIFPVVGGVANATGLNIPLTTSLSDLTVGVNTTCFSVVNLGGCNTASLGANNQFSISLTDIYSSQQASFVLSLNNITGVTGNTMSIVASKPIITNPYTAQTTPNPISSPTT